MVKVLAGKDRGKTGKVLKVLPARNRAVVENINFIKRHTRANPAKNIQGGVLEKELPIVASNLIVICPECSKPTRVGHRHLEDGKSVRVCKKCDGVIDKL
jgi:large subunit ribosomal protein L24